jgi:hypothetical protein
MTVYTFPFPPFDGKLDYEYVKAVVQYKIGKLLKHGWATSLVTVSILAVGVVAGLTPLAISLLMGWFFAIYMSV